MSHDRVEQQAARPRTSAVTGLKNGDTRDQIHMRASLHCFDTYSQGTFEISRYGSRLLFLYDFDSPARARALLVELGLEVGN